MALLLSVAGRVVGCDTVTKCCREGSWVWHLLLSVAGRVVGCGTVTKCCREGSWVWHCY